VPSKFTKFESSRLLLFLTVPSCKVASLFCPRRMSGWSLTPSPPVLSPEVTATQIVELIASVSATTASAQGGMVRDAPWRKLGGGRNFVMIMMLMFVSIIIYCYMKYIYYFTPVHFKLAVCPFSYINLPRPGAREGVQNTHLLTTAPLTNDSRNDDMIQLGPLSSQSLYQIVQIIGARIVLLLLQYSP